MKPKIRFVIQARLTSTRLPKKILLPIDGKPIIQHIYDRLQLINNYNTQTVFAISNEQNESLIEYLEQQKISYYSGSNFNVLERYIQSIHDLNNNDYFVRLTGDNPFVDFNSLSQVLQFAIENNTDYAYMKHIPLGTAAEVVKVEALRKVFKQKNLQPHHTEHVTTYIKDYSQQFNIQFLDYFQLHTDVASWLNNQYPQIRLTIDEEKDYQFSKKIFQYFKKQNNPYFITKDIYQLYNQDPIFFQDNLSVKQKLATDIQKISNK